MDLEALNSTFAIPGVLVFEETAACLTFARITTPAASAVIYLQGAHLTHWQPSGEEPVLFTAAQSDFLPGKAIRGGIPLIFPWFGPYKGEKRESVTYESHGFARTMPWTFASVALSGEDVHLVFTLAPDEGTRTVGFDHFRLAYTLRIGRTLALELAVHNDGPVPLRFEEAFHTYYAVGDVEEVSLDGLAGAAYLDNTENLAPKRQQDPILRFAGRTDSAYLDTDSTCTLRDPSLRRGIAIERSGSRSTVVWNPWNEIVTSNLSPGEWRRFLCVETANAHANAITLAPGATHSMKATVSLSRE